MSLLDFQLAFAAVSRKCRSEIRQEIRAEVLREFERSLADANHQWSRSLDRESLLKEELRAAKATILEKDHELAEVNSLLRLKALELAHQERINRSLEQLLKVALKTHPQPPEAP